MYLSPYLRPEHQIRVHEPDENAPDDGGLLYSEQVPQTKLQGQQSAPPKKRGA
jgi:hypothetical protein